MGVFESADLTPQVLVPGHANEVAVVSEERLVGYAGMFKLGLKQDFRNHQLVRRTRRI